MLNEKFLERIQKLYPDRYQEILSSFGQERVPSVRINTLMCSVEQCLFELRNSGIEFERVFEDGYLILNKTKREITEIEMYKKGWIYLQSLSSMLVGEVLREEIAVLKERGDCMVLDMCASPGSKTSHLSALLGNTGQIVANDVSRERLYRLNANMNQLGVRNVLTHLGHGEHIWKKYGPIFDVVLLDAPCSGEGRFSSEEDAENWSLKDIKRLSTLQKQLMFGAVMCLKTGGTLIYSTCTLAPEENEEIVDFALKKFEGAVDLIQIDLPLGVDVVTSGFKSWENTEFDSTVGKTVRVIPSTKWEGFFVSKFIRN